MKRKGLAIILVVAILASCLVFSSAAADKVLPHSVTLTSCNYSLNGWGNLSAPSGKILGIEGSDGTYIGRSLKANNYKNPGTCINFYYVYGNVKGDGIDLTGCDYLVLHMYFSSAEIAGVNMQVEVNSNTMNADSTGEVERTFTWNDLAGGSLKAGWNDIKVPLSGVSADVVSKFQWLRFFNSGDMTLEADFVYAVDSMYGLKADESKVIVSDCEMAMKGWKTGEKGAIYTPAEDSEDEEDIARTYAEKTFNGNLNVGALMFMYNRNDAYYKDTDKYIEADNAKFLVMDVYISDVSAVTGKDFCLEITSAGKEDAEEWQVVETLDSLSDYTLKDGWNHLVISLDRDGSGNNGVKWDHINFLRFFNNAAITAENLIVGLDEIYLWDGLRDLDDGFEYETYSKSGVNNDFILKEDAGKSGEVFYFADQAKEVVLKFPIKNAATANKVYLTTKTGSQLLLQASGDGEKWSEVFNAGENMLKVGSRAYDLTSYIDFEATDTVYIRFADSTPADGNGGRLYNLELNVAYEVVEAPDPHYTTITALDSISGIGRNLVVNTELKTQGKASVSRVLPKGEVGAAGLRFMVDFASLRTKSFDTTNFYAVVLDVYVSDPSVLKDVTFEMEFTSGGKADAEESHFRDKWSNYVANGENFKKGWNTLVFPFEKMEKELDGLNRTKLNYIRFFNMAAFTLSADTTIAFDNLRLWDGNDGTVETEYSPVLTFSDTLVKYVIPDIYEVKSVYFTGDAGDKIEYSFDAENYKEVAKADGKYDISNVCDFFVPNFEYIYVKAAKTSDLKVVVAHKDVITAEDKDAADVIITTHSVPLNIDSMKWNGTTSVIRSNPTPLAGSTALKVNFSNTQAENNLHQTPNVAFTDTPVDATGMDTLEFDIYFSDAELMNIMLTTINDGQIELCSGGNCDQEETNWVFADLSKYIVGEKEAGKWLHVALPLDAAGGKDCHLDNINYIRTFFRTDVTYNGEDIDNAFFAYDNFRLTDAQAFANIDAKPEADAATALVVALRELLNTPSGTTIAEGAITEANLEAVKAAYTAAKAAADALSAAASSQFKENTFLRKVRSAIEDFGKEPQNPGEKESETKNNPDDESETNGNETNVSNETGGNTTPGGNEKETEETKKKGCKSTIVGGSVLLLIAIGATGAVVAKKKED